jgi:hypothetical protein
LFPAKALASAAQTQNEKNVVGRFLDCVFKYTQSLSYHVTEFLMGGNVNTGVFHPLQLMDFLQRKHMASYRGKRGPQVWTMGVTAASVKRLETKPTGKWTRVQVQSAFEE